MVPFLFYFTAKHGSGECVCLQIEIVISAYANVNG